MLPEQKKEHELQKAIALLTLAARLTEAEEDISTRHKAGVSFYVLYALLSLAYLVTMIVSKDNFIEAISDRIAPSCHPNGGTPLTHAKMYSLMRDACDNSRPLETKVDTCSQAILPSCGMLQYKETTALMKPVVFLSIAGARLLYSLYQYRKNTNQLKANQPYTQVLSDADKALVNKVLTQHDIKHTEKSSVAEVLNGIELELPRITSRM